VATRRGCRGAGVLLARGVTIEPVDGVATRSRLDGVLRRRRGARWPGRLGAEPGHVPMDLPEVRPVTDGLLLASAAVRARETANAPTSLAAAGLGKACVFEALSSVDAEDVFLADPLSVTAKVGTPISARAGWSEIGGFR
jgi:hypothetical protein